MVQSGQRPIRSIEFESGLHEALPVEVIERHEIISRVTPARLALPERPTFHQLMLMRSAGGTHTVDFAAIESRPDRLLRIRPGQVQAWNTRSEFDASLVLSRVTESAADPWFPGDRPYRDLDPASMALAESLIQGLRHFQAVFTASETESRLMVALFEALTALFDAPGRDGTATHLPDVYVSFRRAVEADLAWSHDVTDHARRLGYSARTVSRACQTATGQSAKRVLDGRLVLEAKRLLVHTDLPAAAISAELGFSEPTNFTKFFARNVGRLPSQFRAAGRHQRVVGALRTT
jgi:AraC-like DNA-binding protein